jgi:hypothetical protein
MILQKNFNAKVTAATVNAASTTVGVAPVVAANGSTAARSTPLVATNPPTVSGVGVEDASKVIVDVTAEGKHRVKRGRVDRKGDRRR